MSDDPGSVIGRAIVVGLLALATLGFGLAGLCGALFTVVGFAGLSDKGPENFSGAALVIALPSLVIGGALAWWCGRTLLKKLRRP